MAIPDYQSIMLPLLRLASDGADHRISDARRTLTVEFDLSADEQQIMLASGRETAFSNRVGWARTYLAKAGLLENFARGAFRITDRGRSALAESPARIDVAYLRQFPEFGKFIGLDSAEVVAGNDILTGLETPEEVLARNFRELDLTFERDLLDSLKALDPEPFERLVLDLLVAMKYGGLQSDPTMHTGQPGDEGIDGIVNQDELGLDAVYVQAKRWTNQTVGRPDVQAFVGSLTGKRASKGVLFTTSSFSADAREYVRLLPQRIVLIDGLSLAQLMIKHGLGVKTIKSYAVREIDHGYLESL